MNIARSTDYRCRPGHAVLCLAILSVVLQPAPAIAQRGAEMAQGPMGPGTSIVASVLPISRSVQVGQPATVFATIINMGPGMASGCKPTVAGMPVTFGYHATDPLTNHPVGMPGVPMHIGGGGMQTLMMVFVPTAPMPPTDIPVTFECEGMAAAPMVSGVNTVLLSASSDPTPDMVALIATLGNDGIVEIPGPNGTGVLSVASINMGRGGLITVSVDTGTAVLPITPWICETEPSTGRCVSGLGPAVALHVPAGHTPTFAVFARSHDAVLFDPEAHRLFVRFSEGGVVRGAASAAVRTR